MKGYPKHFATKQDYLNILEFPKFREQCLSDLKSILDTKDDTTLVATTPIDPKDPNSEWNTKTVTNPNPLWKQKGFFSRNEIEKLIQKYQKGVSKEK